MFFSYLLINIIKLSFHFKGFYISMAYARGPQCNDVQK